MHYGNCSSQKKTKSSSVRPACRFPSRSISAVRVCLGDLWQGEDFAFLPSFPLLECLIRAAAQAVAQSPLS